MPAGAIHQGSRNLRGGAYGRCFDRCGGFKGMRYIVNFRESVFEKSKSDSYTSSKAHTNVIYKHTRAVFL